ncbi:MAG: hypothetical protein AAFN70_10380, partial [Planctomycetota bacterium]
EVANDDQGNPFFNIDAVAITAGTNSQLLADSSIAGAGGDVSLSATNINFSFDTLIFNSIAGLDRGATIDIQSESIRGQSVDLLANTGDFNVIGDRLKKLDNKDDTGVNEEAAGGWAAGLLSSLVFSLDDIVSLPATISVKKSTSDIDVSGTAISAADDVTIKADAKSESFGEATYFFKTQVGLAVSVMYAQPSATIDLIDADIVSGRDTKIATLANGVADGEAKVKQNAGLEKKPSQAKESIEIAAAVGVNLPTAKTIVHATSQIDAGGNVSVTSEGKSKTKSTATTTSYIDGTAGITFGLNITQADVLTRVDGDISADSRNVAETIAFDPLADGVVQFAQGIITFPSEHGFTDDDEIVYDSGFGSPLEGLESGDTYAVRVVDEFSIQLMDETQDGDDRVVVFSETGDYPTLTVGNRTLPIVEIEADGAIVFPDYEHGITNGQSITMASAPSRSIHSIDSNGFRRLDGSRDFTAVVDPDDPTRVRIAFNNQPVTLSGDSFAIVGNQAFRVTGYSLDDDSISVETVDGDETSFDAGTAIQFVQGMNARFAGLEDMATYHAIPFDGEAST